MKRALALLALSCGGLDLPDDLAPLFPGTCHYAAGTAHILVSDPSGVYASLEGSKDIPRDVVAECEQGANFADGSRLEMSCEGKPVDYCSVSGECVDAESGVVFWCDGSVEFE